jgi:hypothetical protein
MILIALFLLTIRVDEMKTWLLEGKLVGGGAFR